MRSLLRSPLMYYLRLPMPLRIGLAIGAGGGSIYMLMHFFRGRSLVIIMIGMMVVAFMLIAFRSLLKWRKKRKAAPMEQGIIDQSAATPQGITEGGRRARLDDLRKNFEGGVQKFRAAGKDIYSLPWYVLVGEPGSGKTEAIRHCNVGFPPGLQDPFQGAGGTINMNWWFTNNAVVLDTAGRLMFEEVQAGSTSEWEEFLRLLRSTRPTCPVNGLVLVIPTDTLIADTADAIKSKAEKIAQQLDVIRRILEVRFPVFVIITKSDLINGFREFFEHMAAPHQTFQMLGWSNPAELDETFNPELVDQHLETVCDQLRRRRLGLLLDPVHTDDPNARRTDQVDALFALPQSLKRISSRLKLYLEIVFAGGVWSGKPLFLRGIYFTSAMREGSALDEELAEALGVPVESLPDGRVWEREKSYFLRDVFIEKAFKEWGLVTRATDARKQHRRRKAIVIAAGFLSALLLGFFTWYGAKTLKESIGRQRDYWVAAAGQENWKTNNITKGPDYWRPVVTPEFIGSENWVYSGKAKLKVSGDKIKIADFHHKLFKLADKQIDVPWIFWLARIGMPGIPEKQAHARRVLLEAGILRPVLDAGRKRMVEDADPWSPRATAALAQLIRLETPKPKPPKLDPLFAYVLKRNGQKDADAAERAQPPPRPGADKADKEAAKEADEEADEPADAKLGSSYRDYLKDRDAMKAVLKGTYTNDSGLWPCKAAGIATDHARQAVLGGEGPPGGKKFAGGIGRFVSFWAARGKNASVALSEIVDLKELLLRNYSDAEALLVKVDDEFTPKLGRPTVPEVQVITEAATAWETRLAALQKTRADVEHRLADFPAGAIYPTFEDKSSKIAKEFEAAFDKFRQQAGIQPPDDTDKPGLKGILGKVKDAVQDKVEKKAKAKAKTKDKQPATKDEADDADDADDKKPDTKVAAETQPDPDAQAKAKSAAVVAAVNGRLDAALEELRRVVRPEAIADDVRKVDLEFLNEVSLADDLWKRLAPHELLKRQSAIRKLRLYELRLTMYLLGDAERSRRDQVPEKGTFRDAIRAVGDNIELACAQIGEVKDVAPKAFRSDDAAAVSVFTCRRLAMRQRIHHMLRSLLTKAPTRDEEVAQHVAARAQGLRQVLKPRIPLTNMKGGAFEPRYHPGAMLAVLRECRDAGTVLQDPKVAVLEREKLIDLWKQWRLACGRYADGEYFRYWTQKVPADLESHGQDWKSYRRQMRAMQPFDTFIALGDIGKAVSDALSDDIVAMLPSASQQSFQRARDTMANNLRKLQNNVYQSKCRLVRGNWCKLNEDAFEARNTLVPIPRDQVFEDYLAFFYNVPEQFADKYWADLTHEALRLIIAWAGRDGLAAFDELRRRYSRFPLDVPREGEQALAQREVSAARDLVAKLVLTAGARGLKTRRDREEDVDPGRREIERLLDQLADLRIDPKQWEWIGKLKAVLDGLPSANKVLKCGIWITAAQPRDPVGYRWVHVRAFQGKAEVGKGNAAPGLDTKLCDDFYPGEGIELRFHRHPSDPDKGLPPNRTLVVEGPWAIVRLLHPGKVNDPLYLRRQFVHAWSAMPTDERRETFDPETRDILVTIEDDQGVRRQLRLRLKFEKGRGLPATDKWPTRSGQ